MNEDFPLFQHLNFILTFAFSTQRLALPFLHFQAPLESSLAFHNFKRTAEI